MGDLASFQGRELLLIIVNQNDFMSHVDKARPGHKPNVSRSYNRNMHPLLPAKRERFEKYFISFSVELPPITDARDRNGQGSHRQVTTVTASNSALLARPHAVSA